MRNSAIRARSPFWSPSVAAAALVFAAAPASACGVTIEAGSASAAFVAPTDCVGTALTVVGPVDLDLGGQTITCESNDHPNVGIHVRGEGAVIRNGGVAGCEVGVLVEGDGGHLLARVEAHDNGEHVKESGGFEIRSDDNRLRRVEARDNGLFGIRVDGNRNVIRSSVISGNEGYGVIVFGAENTLANLTANNNENSNIGVSHLYGAATQHHLGGDHNRILNSQANNSGNDGIVLSGDHNLVRGNEASGNFTDGIEIDEEGDHNRIISNTALDNHLGSEVEGVDFGGADLEDSNVDCGNNRWRDNTFATSRENSAADEIDGPACIH